MRVVNVEVDMIATFDREGNPKPVKFKYIDADGEEIVIQVDKMILRQKKKMLDLPVITFQCQSLINNYLKGYELLYDVKKARWRLFKI